MGQISFLLVCILTLPHDAVSQSQESGYLTVAEPGLRAELLRRAEQDQAIRNELIAAGIRKPDTKILARMKAIDASNTQRLREIVDKYGWPTPALVGRDGVQSAFILVQHSEHQFQKEMLPLVEYRKALKNVYLPADNGRQ